MSSISRFQTKGLNALWLTTSVSTLANAITILMPMAVPRVCR